VSERDLFANFERMRREMDELFGDVFERAGLARGRRTGFSPRVDVYYTGNPPAAVVKAELAGIDPEAVKLEVQGRELVISGDRPAGRAEGRVYQQLEIETGPFRRAVQLGADVRAEAARATYEDGVLRIELPLAERDTQTRSVPIEVPRASGR
jgi:HSP20 family protein